MTFLNNGTVGTTWIGPQAYNSASPLGDTAAVDAADTRAGGVRYTTGGAIRLVDATAGLPAGAVNIGGFAISTSGQLCYTTDAPTASSVKIGGVAVTQDGRVHSVITV